MLSNRIKNIENPCSGIFPIDRIEEQRLFSKIIEKGDYSQVLELSITFISSSENIRYEYYLKQPMQSIEKNLNRLNYKNPKLVQEVNQQNSSYPFPGEYTKELIDEKKIC